MNFEILDKHGFDVVKNPDNTFNIISRASGIKLFNNLTELEVISLQAGVYYASKIELKHSRPIRETGYFIVKTGEELAAAIHTLR